jgi:hypothetical protein
MPIGEFPTDHIDPANVLLAGFSIEPYDLMATPE